MKYLFSNLYFQISMFIIRTATFIIKTVFVSHSIRFTNSKSLLKISNWPYILFSTVGTYYQTNNIATITWQITFNEICIFCYCTYKLLSVMKTFLQMSHLLQLAIVWLHLMLGLGYKEGATISLGFCYVYK